MNKKGKPNVSKSAKTNLLQGFSKKEVPAKQGGYYGKPRKGGNK